MAQTDHTKPGLRERKKAKTRAMIQRHALKLFQGQGYEETSISQIAEAAEISESTFFRYFPAKEDLVRWDEFDPLILEAFRAQPSDVKSIPALRGALRDVLARLSMEERAALRERIVLMLAVPHVIGADQLNGPMQLLRQSFAERTGRAPDDFAIWTLVGAVLGVGVAVMFAAMKNPQADIIILLDAALAQLEAGFQI